MSERPMLMVFCYDVSRSSVRSRVAEMLEDQAVRVQDSVFECRLTRRAAERLFARASALLDDGDSLRMYAVPAAGLARSMAVGRSPIPDDADHWII